MADDAREIERLYQLPLGEFTAARNTLAKALKRPDVKALEKPNVAAWAVNQLYWHERPAYDALMAAAARLRTEHRNLLAGRSADLRAAERAHRDAIRAALGRVQQLLHDAGQATSQATMTAVQETLEALPAGEAPGRLTRPLKPQGFEALAGVMVKPQLRVVRSTPAADGAKAALAEAERGPSPAERARQRAEARARERRQKEAQKAVRAAEQKMLEAEDAVKAAERALAEARRARDAAVAEYQLARLRE